MPQLTPFFFVNQVVFNFALLLLITYLFTKYIHPNYITGMKSRLHIHSL